MDRVVGLQVGDSWLAITLERLQRDRVVPVEIEGRGAVVWLLPATTGPAAGQRLDPIEHVDAFWFAWSAYHPETVLID
jgi:hypothetical protein